MAGKAKTDEQPEAADDHGHEHEHDHDHDHADCGHDHQHHEPFRRAEPKVGRNDPCPCGSGRKHKKCCGA